MKTIKTRSCRATKTCDQPRTSSRWPLSSSPHCSRCCRRRCQRDRWSWATTPRWRRPSPWSPSARSNHRISEGKVATWHVCDAKAPTKPKYKGHTKVSRTLSQSPSNKPERFRFATYSFSQIAKMHNEWKYVHFLLQIRVDQLTGISPIRRDLSLAKEVSKVTWMPLVSKISLHFGSTSSVIRTFFSANDILTKFSENEFTFCAATLLRLICCASKQPASGKYQPKVSVSRCRCM